MARAARVRPSGDEIHHQLQRIIGSATFRDSLRLTRFLSFVVEAATAGRADRIKAYTIAVEAFGRGSDFDPQSDPIVRVEAVRLRRALARYYAGEGRDDPLLINLPRGAYVPHFRRRPDRTRAALRAAARRRPDERTMLSQRLNEIAERSMQLNRSLSTFEALLDIQRQQLVAVTDAIVATRQILQHARELLQSACAASVAGKAVSPFAPSPAAHRKRRRPVTALSKKLSSAA